MTTASPQSPASNDTPRRPRPNRRGVIAIAVVVLALVTLLVVGLFLGGGDPARVGGRLDPTNLDGDGARALAHVLEDQGVDVIVARDAAALDRAGSDRDTTVVVSDPRYLSADRAEDLAATEARVLVLDATGSLSRDLGARGRQVAPTTAVEADCRLGGGSDLADVSGLEIQVEVGIAYAGANGCFEVDDAPMIAVIANGVVLVGIGDALTNGQVLEGDNAAVALRLLGATDRLIWYIPAESDLDQSDEVGLATFLPAWYTPVLWLGVVAVLALAWCQGRRLGPLATEPLPVVVRAIESTDGRGRLYRRSRDRAHTARVLREASRRRIAAHLAHPRNAAPAALIHEVAVRTGRPPQQVGELLDPAAPVPTDDTTLMAFAQSLAELEKEVRRT